MARPDFMALFAATLLGALPAAADVICRPNTLGTVSCPSAEPRPRPRALYGEPVQAIDRVRAKPEVATSAPDFVPARRTEGLGTIILDGGAGDGICRPDTLGNLRCR